MAPTNFAIRIVELLGCIPVIAEKQPKGSSSVFEVVTNNMKSCDAVIVLATRDQENEGKFSPSNGVSEELGILKNDEKFRNRYFVITEKGVELSAMNNIARYSFSADNFGPIAEAIIVELGSMSLFRNYYEMPGSEIEIHTLMDALAALKKVVGDGHLNKNQFKEAVESIMKQFVDKIVSES
jgi:hypothetical protein